MIELLTFELVGPNRITDPLSHYYGTEPLVIKIAITSINDFHTFLSHYYYYFPTVHRDRAVEDEQNYTYCTTYCNNSLAKCVTK